MSDSTEIEVAIARPLITPEQAEAAAKELRDVIARVLVKGKHYQKIRGKDVLLKAGAEELQKVFGLSYSLPELVTTYNDDGAFAASVLCSVQNGQGRVLSESYGLYDGNEPNGPHSNNKIVKMAQKRAYVGAIMAATGTSELFTQDLEDEGQPPPPPRPSTPDERLLLAELFAKKGGGTLVAAREWLDSKAGKGERDWVANRVLDLLLKPDPKDAVAKSAAGESNGPEGEPSADSPSTTTEPDPGFVAPEKKPEFNLSTQQADSEAGGLPDPELPPDPPTIEVEAEEDDDDHPF